jgi:anaphase-promoting complex subunit 2
VTDCLEEYSKAFETLKKIRTLVWKPHLGSVNLDIEIGGKKWNMTVSPVHAVIIYHFQTKEQWTAKELVN